jgi:hypothetical protein
VQREDPEWLDKMLPLGPNALATDGKRNAYRQQLLQRFKPGDKVNHRELRKFSAGWWISIHDRDWLQSTFRFRRGARTDSDLRAKYRVVVTDALKASPGLGRSQVCEIHPTAINWLRVNDVAWLDSACPKKSRGPR